MLRTNIKFAFRNITRNKVYAVINIAGLAISLTAFMLMALYIEDELSFDKFNKNADNIYRVADDKQTPDVLLRSAQSAAPVAPALKQDFPDIKEAARLIQAEYLVKYHDKLFEERRIFFSDPSLFSIFTFHLVKGSTNDALKEPSSIVLTASTSKKYFGNADAIGKVLIVDGTAMRVTGVVEDIPANSHLQFDFLISMSTAEQKGTGYDWLFSNWYSNNFYTYILLPSGYDVGRLTAQLGNFDKRHKEANSNTVHNYALEKLTDIYLHSDRDNQVGKTGRSVNLAIFSVIALFILLIACVNFINLSTARFAARAKEVAVKKMVGAARFHMAAQFLTESFLITAASIAAAVVVTLALLPYFNIFSGKTLSAHLSYPAHIASLLLLLVIIGLLSGSYPAFVLSGFKPATSLKGKVSASVWSIGLRKGLVVFQFTISIILIVCSMLVHSQMYYLQNHDLGFKPSQTMIINFEGDQNVQKQISTIRQQLLNIPEVQDISASSNVPGDGSGNTWSMDFVKKTGDTIHTELPIFLTDYSFLSQYRIPMVAGRGFSEAYPADSISSMLINETALKKLGFASANDAIGVRVGMYPNHAIITGVFKDFHFESLQKPVAPLALRMMPFKFRLLSIHINSSRIRETVAAIESSWKKLVPERPLEYSFLDETFNRQYEAEVKFGQVFNSFSVLAIVIACLGLFGLALFSVQQRTKEIGIRKVLGASVISIVTMLSANFLRPVLIASVIAFPIAWLLMHKWLQDFAYRVNISWWIFGIAAMAALVIALITVSFQTIKAAASNPVKSLRSE